MADFNKSLKRTLRHEGGYINDPDDSGGETIFGISRKNNPRWMGWVWVDSSNTSSDKKRAHTLAQNTEFMNLVTNLYKRKYWGKYAGYIKNQKIADHIFDMSVNMGKMQAVRLVQEACGNIYADTSLVIDGKLGPKTLGAIQVLSRKKEIEFNTMLLKKRINFYFMLSFRKRSQVKFLKGWINRAITYIIK